MRTSIYVDGFNLYYRTLKGTPYKWFDIKLLVSNLLQSQNKINEIKYFTAIVSGMFDPNHAWLDKYDCAVIISNDSDLAEPLRIIREQHNKKIIGLLSPVIEGHPSNELQKYAHFVKRIRKGVLKASQLPDKIPGTKIHKPAQW